MVSGPHETHRPVLDANDPSALDAAAAALGDGKLVVVPTDTVYGIAARVDRPEALRRLFEVKGRPPELPVAVLVAGLDDARRIGVFDPPAMALAEKFWPGPLTIVVPGARGFDLFLGADDQSVGIRMPDHPAALDLLRRSGPLATSSANLSGEGTPRSVGPIQGVFGDSVAVYLDGGTLPLSAPSSVVSVHAGALEMIREGTLSEKLIRAALES